MTTDYEQFLKLVQSMRDCQKEYFKTRDAVALRTCKDLERQVDLRIARELSKQIGLL